MKARPTVLILATSALPAMGGLQTLLKWFLDGLDGSAVADGIDVHFACSDVTDPEFVDFENIQVHGLSLRGRGVGLAGRLIWRARLIWRVGSLVREVRPDVVHCHALAPDGYMVVLGCILFRVSARVVATTHGQDVLWLPDVPYGSLGRLRARLLARFVTSRLTAHVAVSRVMACYAIKAGSPRNRVRVIHNGVPGPGEPNFETNPAILRPSPPPAVSRRGDGINILCLSAARAVKNLPTLIHAFAIAGPDLADSRLYLACPEQQAGPVKRLVRESGLEERVEFVDAIRGGAKHDWFRICDVLCVPSWFEAFSLTALEGMRFGTAVVATREGGVSEFLEDGVNGLLISPADPAECAAALVRLYREPDLRRRLAEEGRRTAGRFSISSVVDQHVRLWAEIAK